MKILSILLILLMLVGMAGAQWYPKSLDLNTTGDVNADNGAFSGDLNVNGTLTTGVGPIADGVYDSDLRLAANHSFYSTTGSGGIDWSNGTGAWKMPTGAGTIGGTLDINDALTTRDITLDANKNLTMSGTGTVTTGTGAVDVNGALTTKGITQDSGYSITQAGASGIIVGTTGINATASPLKLLENVTVSANKNIVTSGTGTITSAATITGEQLTSTDDAFVTDDLTVDGGARIDETATINALVVNNTATIGGVAVRPGIVKRTLAAGTAAATNVTVSGMASGDELISVVALTTAAAIASMAERTSEYAVGSGILVKAAGTNETGNQLDIMWMDKT